MTINLIDPKFNIISTIQPASAGQSSNQSHAANAGGDLQRFSDVFETVISGTQKQMPEVSDVSGSKVNLDEIFQKASETYHVPVELLKAVAKAESNFNPNAESHAGAQGIMQLMPGTARGLGVTDAFDPEQNIMGGAKYLSQQLERYDGNTVLALAAYNAGPGNVAKYNGVPPFNETRNYIAKVMGYTGESITAGDAVLPNQAVTADSESILKEMGLRLLNDNPGGMNIKDYALLMDLYRYRMQLNVLSESDSDSELNTSELLAGFTGLI